MLTIINICLTISIFAQNSNKIPVYDLENQEYSLVRDTFEIINNLWTTDSSFVSTKLKINKRFYLNNNENEVKSPILYKGLIFTSYNYDFAIDLETEEKVFFGSKDIEDIFVLYPSVLKKDFFIKNIKTNETVFNYSENIDLYFSPLDVTPFQSNKIIYKYSQKYSVKNDWGERIKLKDYTVLFDLIKKDTIWKIESKNSLFLPVKGDTVLVNFQGQGLMLFNIHKGNNIAIIKGKNPFSNFFKIEGNIVYAIIDHNELQAIDISTGEIIWGYIGDLGNKFLMDNETIYTSRLRAIDKKSGKILWKNNLDANASAIVGNYIIAYFNTGDDSEILLVDKKTGMESNYNKWDDTSNQLCDECLGYKIEPANYCLPQFYFIKEYSETKTAAIVKCVDGLYLYILELQ